MSRARGVYELFYHMSESCSVLRSQSCCYLKVERILSKDRDCNKH